MKFPFVFRPRLRDDLRGYDRARFARDLGAGVTVGIVALPLAMAFAIASGLKPEAGLWTAIIAGLLRKGITTPERILASGPRAERVAELTRAVAAADLPDEGRSRIRAALADAERVLRRDDDGREAARHLQSALRLADDRPRPPSPF